MELGTDHERTHDAVCNLGLLAQDRRDLPAASRWFGRVVDSGHEDGLIVAEAACRAGEILHRRGERSAARPLLERAAATGDAFAEQAASLLADPR